jgi:hypothetical protein
VNDSEDFGDRGTLLCELAVDRRILALDTSAQAQEFSVVAHARDLQIRLPSAHIDQPFQLAILKKKKKRKNISVTFSPLDQPQQKKFGKGPGIK